MSAPARAGLVVLIPPAPRAMIGRRRRPCLAQMLLWVAIWHGSRALRRDQSTQQRARVVSSDKSLAVTDALLSRLCLASDKPGNHNFELLKKLVLPDGSVLRAQLPGRPTRDCLFADPARDGTR